MLTDLKKNLIKEAKRIEEDCKYSANSHFIASNRWSKYHLWIGIPSSIIATVAGASILSQFDQYDYLSGILAIIVAALTATSTFLNPSGKASNHQSSGTKYRSLSNRSRIFYEIDCLSELSEGELSKSLTELSKQRDDLNENSPQIPRWAYEKTKIGIEKGETDYEVDERVHTLP